MLWCTHDLAAHGFVPEVCKGDCKACVMNEAVGKVRHLRSLDSCSLAERISVPDQLVASVFMAAHRFLVSDTC